MKPTLISFLRFFALLGCLATTAVGASAVRGVSLRQDTGGQLPTVPQAPTSRYLMMGMIGMKGSKSPQTLQPSTVAPTPETDEVQASEDYTQEPLPTLPPSEDQYEDENTDSAEGDEEEEEEDIDSAEGNFSVDGA